MHGAYVRGLGEIHQGFLTPTGCTTTSFRLAVFPLYGMIVFYDFLSFKCIEDFVRERRVEIVRNGDLALKGTELTLLVDLAFALGLSFALWLLRLGFAHIPSM